MMVRRMLRNVTRQLADLDLRSQIPFEAREENFALAWFQAITKMWDRSFVVGDRELDHLEVDEIEVAELLDGVIDVPICDVGIEPLFSLVAPFLSENKVD